MREFFANLLITVGGLIAILSGLCSLTAVATAFTQLVADPHSAGGVLSMVFVFGGLPFLIGAGLLAFGLHLLRGIKRRDR